MATASSCPDAMRPLTVRVLAMSSVLQSASCGGDGRPVAPATDRLPQEFGDSIDRVEMRRRDVGQASQFNDRAEQRLDLDRAAVLDVLQHRGLVGDALSAGD